MNALILSPKYWNHACFGIILVTFRGTGSTLGNQSLPSQRRPWRSAHKLVLKQQSVASSQYSLSKTVTSLGKGSRPGSRSRRWQPTRSTSGRRSVQEQQSVVSWRSFPLRSLFLGAGEAGREVDLGGGNRGGGSQGQRKHQGEDGFSKHGSRFLLFRFLVESERKASVRELQGRLVVRPRAFLKTEH